MTGEPQVIELWPCGYVAKCSAPECRRRPTTILRYLDNPGATRDAIVAESIQRPSALGDSGTVGLRMPEKVWPCGTVSTVGTGAVGSTTIGRGVMVITVGCEWTMVRSRNAITLPARLASMRSRRTGSRIDAAVRRP